MREDKTKSRNAIEEKSEMKIYLCIGRVYSLSNNMRCIKSSVWSHTSTSLFIIDSAMVACYSVSLRIIPHFLCLCLCPSPFPPLFLPLFSAFSADFFFCSFFLSISQPLKLILCFFYLFPTFLLIIIYILE